MCYLNNQTPDKLPYIQMYIYVLDCLRKKITREEGGAHPRISVWHLLMNLKSNFFIKKTVEVGQ